MKRNYQESDFAEEKKLPRLMRELPDETKKLISAAIKSDSAPISAMKKKEKGNFLEVLFISCSQLERHIWKATETQNFIF